MKALHGAYFSVFAAISGLRLRQGGTEREEQYQPQMVTMTQMKGPDGKTRWKDQMIFLIWEYLGSSVACLFPSHCTLARELNESFEEAFCRSRIIASASWIGSRRWAIESDMRLTKAEPTMAALACSVAARTWSAVPMPKPTAIGSLVTSRSAATLVETSGAPEETPVIPVRAMR